MRAAQHLDPAELRHQDVDESDRGAELLDLVERLLAVTRTADDRDAPPLEELRDGVEDGGMVVGDDAGDACVRRVDVLARDGSLDMCRTLYQRLSDPVGPSCSPG